MPPRSAVPQLSPSWFADRYSRSAALEIRTIPAAIRVPPKRLSGAPFLVFPPGNPRLYVHEGARQGLERRFTLARGALVVLSITDNRHAMISQTRHGGVLFLRLHHMFLGAGDIVVDALVRYVLFGDKEASIELGHFIESNGHTLARRSPRAVPLTTSGKHHDLLRILEEVQQRYFPNTARALITWGPRTKPRGGEGPRPKRKTIKLGSYSFHERIIRIHPALDRSWVPRYFVAFVVYHELLHHFSPSTRGRSARRALHPPEFLAKERAFRNYERAVTWQSRNLSRLLRA
ncbi:MAG: hypothetical protein U0174_24770 [Polyangiaceae bacterium]